MYIITIQQDEKGQKRQVAIEIVPKTKKKQITFFKKAKQRWRKLFNSILPVIEI